MVNVPHDRVQVPPSAIIESAIALLSAPAALVVIVRVPGNDAPEPAVVGMVAATMVSIALAPGATSADREPSEAAPCSEYIPPGAIDAR